MTETDIIAKLKEVNGAFEIYHVVSRFKLYRKAEDDSTQAVSVEILDAGPNGNPNLRYHCTAKANNGKTATGNPDSTTELALINVHWEHLDWPI